MSMNRMIKIVAGVLLLAFATSPALAQQESFVMPSGNVECTYTGPAGTSVYQPTGGRAELSCDRAEPTYVRVIMSTRGAVKLIRNVGDPSCCGIEPKLTYGTVWRRAPFTCESNEAGIICRHDDGAGFQMSRRGVSLQ
jgi:hypothetical protein